MKITQKITAMIIAAVIAVVSSAFLAFGAESVKGSEVADFACKYEGYGYQYASKGPNKFDCSGFVYYVLGNFGIRFGNSTSEYNSKEEAKNYGTVIDDIKDAKLGDIVVWGSHAAVYLGDGKSISAMNSKMGVCIRPVDDFVDKNGAKNPSHFFIRPDEYVEETEETASEDETKTEPERMSLRERIKERRDARREYVKNLFNPITEIFE